ncbi:MAG: hypothetical protein R6U44_08445 [Archaeoglobaceae archaeon]
MNNRKVAYVVLLAILVIVLAGAAYKLVFLNVVEGNVSHKSVSGMKGDTVYGIILNRPISDGSWIVVRDDDYGKYFSGKHVVINETVEERMTREYRDLKYQVNVNVSPEEGTEGYQTSREIFNQIRVGEKVKMEVTRFSDTPSIIGVVENE